MLIIFLRDQFYCATYWFAGALAEEFKRILGRKMGTIKSLVTSHRHFRYITKKKFSPERGTQSTYRKTT